MMARTQITLDPEIHRRARARAAELGISFAEYVRRAVADSLAGSSRRTDVSVIFGLGNSGGSDIATHKHEYIEEAVEAEYERERS